MSKADRVGAQLARARALGIDRLDAQRLLAHVLSRSRAWVLAHDEALLDAAQREALDQLFARRAAGEPLAYLIGEREFHGLALRVSPDVLIPRPDTETLVDAALDALHGPLAAEPEPRVLDLGTGSGAIALALKAACPRARVHASDASAAALAVARANGERLGLTVAWQRGDWWQAVDGLLRMHLVVSNPPYVAAGDPHLADLAYEPPSALVPQGDGGDGLADLERIVRGAPEHLLPGAWLLLEHGADQAAAVTRSLDRAGFGEVRTHRDLAGRERVTGGRWSD